jgi:hypothetical protein
MTQDDFDRLHEYLLERESIPEADDPWTWPTG